MGQNSDRGNFDFQISAQSLIKENCHNSRTGDDIDMKLGPITKLGKRQKTPSKKIDDDVMSETFYVIVIFLVYGQLGAIRKPHCGRILYKTYIFIKGKLLSYKD